MMVERGNFIHLSHRDVHQFRQGHQMPFVQATEGVVEDVQLLDE